MSDFAFYKQEFLDLFRSTANGKHRYQVFSDFVVCSATALHNGIAFDEERENHYMNIVKDYSKSDLHNFSCMLGALTVMLEFQPYDILGELYMELELGSKDSAQFFTPFHMSELLAAILYDEDLKMLDKPFIKLSDPACGAGGMVLAFVKQMLANGHNPSERLFVQCIDIDKTAALMAYLQLSLCGIGVPAEIIVGDTLRMDFKECWYTPIYYAAGWYEKLEWEKKVNAMRSFLRDIEQPLDDNEECEPLAVIEDGSAAVVVEPKTEEKAPASSQDDQLGFDFIIAPE